MAATKALLLSAALAALSLQAAAETMTVEETVVMDYRPAVARIEAADSATARSRLQAVVSRLSIDEGDVVKAGRSVAIVTDATSRRTWPRSPRGSRRFRHRSARRKTT